MIEELALAANGIRFHALAAGPHDGPLVLLLHGFPELARSWRHQLPALGGAGYRAVAPDLRGYGETELCGPYDVGTLVRDVTGLIEALGRDRAVVVGHDWGGAVAWATAMRAPEVVERLVAMNCPPASALAHAMRHSREQRKRSRYIFFFQLPWLPERRMAADGAAVVARALVGGSHRKDVWPPEELAAYRAAFCPSFRRRRPKGSTRPRVSAPTLVLWGAEDRFLGRQLVSPDALRRALADGNVPEVVFIDDAGHFVQNEAPERVNEELLRWLGPASR